jgi:hypothetical protein
MTSKIKPNAPHRLIVEGRDDQWSIIALTAKHGWDWDKPDAEIPYVDNAEGVNNALEALPAAIKSCSRVGIVVDADTSPTNRWEQIGDRIRGEGFTLPTEPDVAGTVVSSGTKRVGVWLMPNNVATGKLEDFLAFLVPPNDGRWQHAETSTREAKTLNAPFEDKDFIKALIHTWLAWQENPGQPFGTSITATIFAHDAPLATAFVCWLRRLYF